MQIFWLHCSFISLTLDVELGFRSASKEASWRSNRWEDSVVHEGLISIKSRAHSYQYWYVGTTKIISVMHCQNFLSPSHSYLHIWFYFENVVLWIILIRTITNYQNSCLLGVKVTKKLFLITALPRDDLCIAHILIRDSEIPLWLDFIGISFCTNGEWVFAVIQ